MTDIEIGITVNAFMKKMFATTDEPLFLLGYILAEVIAGYSQFLSPAEVDTFMMEALSEFRKGRSTA